MKRFIVVFLCILYIAPNICTAKDLPKEHPQQNTYISIGYIHNKLLKKFKAADILNKKFETTNLGTRIMFVTKNRQLSLQVQTRKVIQGVSFFDIRSEYKYYRGFRRHADGAYYYNNGRKDCLLAGGDGFLGYINNGMFCQFVASKSGVLRTRNILFSRFQKDIIKKQKQELLRIRHTLSMSSVSPATKFKIAYISPVYIFKEPATRLQRLFNIDNNLSKVFIIEKKKKLYIATRPNLLFDESTQALTIIHKEIIKKDTLGFYYDNKLLIGSQGRIGYYEKGIFHEFTANDQGQLIIKKSILTQTQTKYITTSINYIEMKSAYSRQIKELKNSEVIIAQSPTSQTLTPEQLMSLLKFPEKNRMMYLQKNEKIKNQFDIIMIKIRYDRKVEKKIIGHIVQKKNGIYYYKNAILSSCNGILGTIKNDKFYRLHLDHKGNLKTIYVELSSNQQKKLYKKLDTIKSNFKKEYSKEIHNLASIEKQVEKLGERLIVHSPSSYIKYIQEPEKNRYKLSIQMTGYINGIYTSKRHTVYVNYKNQTECEIEFNSNYSPKKVILAFTSLDSKLEINNQNKLVCTIRKGIQVKNIDFILPLPQQRIHPSSHQDAITEKKMQTEYTAPIKIYEKKVTENTINSEIKTNKNQSETIYDFSTNNQQDKNNVSLKEFAQNQKTEETSSWSIGDLFFSIGSLFYSIFIDWWI